MRKKVALLTILLFFSTVSLYAKNQTAIFAGGCFWCMQSDFDKLSGVLQTTVGYDGGTSPNPTYEKVSSGKTQYLESVKVMFDDQKISYIELLDYFWKHIDPTDKEGQFCDRGQQYRSAIFYLNSTQKEQALASLQKLKKKFPTVDTTIAPSTQFYPAEEYHQNYYKKHPIKYRFYRLNCSRDERLEKVWPDG